MLTWYLARGAGIAAFAALSVSTAAGALGARRSAAREGRVVVQYVHRASAVAGLVLLALHICTLLADSYARVGVTGALLPFGSGYRPLAVTFGVLALYLLAATAATGLLRSRFTRSDKGVRSWRAIHLAGYASWVSAGVHVLTAGTDAGRWWARSVAVAGALLVAGALAARASGTSRRSSAGRRYAPVPVGVRS